MQQYVASGREDIGATFPCSNIPLNEFSIKTLSEASRNFNED